MISKWGPNFSALKVLAKLWNFVKACFFGQSKNEALFKKKLSIVQGNLFLRFTLEAAQL